MNGPRSSHRRLRAVIYVLLGRPQSDQWLRECHEHVDDKGYKLVALSEEDDEVNRPKFADAIRMLITGEAEVIVVATADYLPGDWVPRLEVAGADPEPFAIPPENRPVSKMPQQRRARRGQRPEH